MKKLLSGILVIAMIVAWTPNTFAALNPVTSSRSDSADDQANGVQFNDLGFWTLSIADGNSLGSTGGVSANTLFVFGRTSTLRFVGNSTTPGTIGPAASGAKIAINNTGSSAGKIAVFMGDVLVNGAIGVAINAAGEMDFNGNLTSTGSTGIYYTATGTIQMADGKSITS